MLRSNCKIVKERIQNYILDNSKDYLLECNYIKKDATKEEIFKAIAKTFYNEKFKYHSCVSDFKYLEKNYNYSLYEAFKDWAQGLACGALFDYYINPCIPIIGTFLEETIEERRKYTEVDAEELMTKLIYRELNISKYIKLN